MDSQTKVKTNMPATALPSLMRAVVLGKAELAALQPSLGLEPVAIDGLANSCGTLWMNSPSFDAAAPALQHAALIKIKGFSCNYRDKSLSLGMLFTQGAQNNGYYVIGSEFVGEVLAVGEMVSALAVGDRVMGNNAYWGIAQMASPPQQQGVVTNHASREYQILPADRLVKVPDTMPDAVAAGFSIAAQTAYGMVEKVGRIHKNATCLVTAAKSNTSLAVIKRLQRENIRVFATSTSDQFADELNAMGVEELFVPDPQARYFTQHPRLQKIAQAVGLFDYIFDPFFDLHIEKALPLVKPYGRYVTCGLFAQHGLGMQTAVQSIDLASIMNWALLNNISLVGHCLGTTHHLQQAIHDFAAGRFAIPIDTIFTGNQVQAFLHRTYNSKERFGKVIYQYE